MYWRLIKVSAGLAALGVLAWGALLSLGMYEGYAELVLAVVFFAPVGVVFILNGLGISYAVALRIRAALGSRRKNRPTGVIGWVALVGALFLLSGWFFASLAWGAVLAILSR